LTLKLKAGRKGYIILPKAVREAVGIEESDEVLVEIRDGILLKPVKKKVVGRTIAFLEQNLAKTSGF
jgi:AbrB family looped-hinge helix DNA binding protein